MACSVHSANISKSGGSHLTWVGVITALVLGAMPLAGTIAAAKYWSYNSRLCAGAGCHATCKHDHG